VSPEDCDGNNLMHRLVEQQLAESASPDSRGSQGVEDDAARRGAFGEFERMLDDKGRVTIPPKVRAALGTDFVTARGASGSVLVIPGDQWPAVEAQLRENLDSGDRYYQFAIHNYTRTSLDRQGRLKLPKHLLEWAAIVPGDAAAVIASGQKFEIWSRRAWTDRQKEPRSNGAGSAHSEEDTCDSSAIQVSGIPGGASK
jgi:MraZ protein